ncbi:hypothetical protein MX850_12460 [Erysipelothrix sp. Poltava]|nr:hypothetical protein MX850_12460 [Erysipelothrix sp. Poltava]
MTKKKSAKVISEVIGTPYHKVLEIISQDALQVEFGYAGKYLTLDQKTNFRRFKNSWPNV